MEKKEEISLLMACYAKEEANHNLWYLDIGWSNHICGDKSAFSELDESFRDTVKFGDDPKVMGKGKVTIQTKGNSFRSIVDVLLVPNLKTKFLSIVQLQEKGYEVFIKGGVCRIFDEKLGLIFSSQHDCKSYVPTASQQYFSYMFFYKVRRRVIAVALPVWTSKLWWLKDVAKKEYGGRTTKNCYTRSSL